MKYIFNELKDKGLIFGRNNIINELKERSKSIKNDKQRSTQSPKVKTAHKLQDTEMEEQINENSK